MTTPPIPPALIEAGAIGLAESRYKLILPKFVQGSHWDDPPVPASAVESWRESFRQEARAVLAAAFAVCDVDEEQPWDWSPARRLVITTPAEQVDTEGATT